MLRHVIGYLRVSTREQGRSGLGLAAQREAVERFCEQEGFAVVPAWWAGKSR
jgi:DNA invertase Pin-like site-specific DNA recombinase